MTKLDTMTDYELVDLYEKGNDSAFDALLNRHQAYVYSYILFFVHQRDIADDIFQETFTRAIIAIRSHHYQTTGKFSAWLIRIAHNLVIDYLRDNGNSNIVATENFPERLTNSMRHSENAHEARLVEEQNMQTLRHLLDFLPAPQAEVVLMRFYKDMSFKEIAEATGVSINTSLGRMRYALINLRKLIQRHNISLAV